MRRILWMAALAVPSIAGTGAAYDLWPFSLTGDTHPFYIDVTGALCSTPSDLCANCSGGTVQDWVEATILAAQAWSNPNVTDARFRFVFAGFIAPSSGTSTYPPDVNVVTFGASCIGYPTGAGTFHTCMFADIPFDVSGAPGLGCFDLEGSMVHQLGHALGLKHSNVLGASMSTTSPTAVEWRSLHADDIAGLRAIYDRLPANDPVVAYAGVPFTGRTIRVQLSNVTGPAVVGFDLDAGPKVLSPTETLHLGFSPTFFYRALLAPNWFALEIPADPNLAGTTFFMQASAFVGWNGINPSPFRFSNPSRITIPY